MHFIFRFAIITFSISLLAACSSPTMKQFQTTDQLDPNKGIIVFRVTSNHSLTRVNLKSEYKNNMGAVIWMTDVKLHNELYHSTFVMQVEPGYTYFGKIGLLSNYLVIPENRRLSVEVKPGYVTYIGDLYAYFVYDERNLLKVNYSIAREQDRALAELKVKNPWLLERYPLNDSPNIKPVPSRLGSDQVN